MCRAHQHLGRGYGVYLQLLLFALSFASCKQENLEPVTNVLRFVPLTLEFPPGLADQRTRQQEVSIVNDGRASLEVKWKGLSSPFSSDALPELLQPGSTPLFLQWTPQAPGRSSQVLEVESDGIPSVSLTVSAVAEKIPTCIPSSPCVSTRFDLDTQSCTETPQEDGLACDPGTLCQLNSYCQGGRCVGTARVCADQNLCTTDVCYPLTGCEFLPAPPCPGDGACLEGICEPTRGCGLQPRPDGASCGGSTTSCTEVRVCIEGTCVNRDPPDGYVCAEESPCASEGRCINDVCVRDTRPRALEPNWTFDTVAIGALDAGPPPRLHDFVLEPDGQMSLSGFFDVGAVLRANTAGRLNAPLGSSRRCILWNSRYVCADYPANPGGKVTALELDSAAAAWTFDIRAARPDFLSIAPTLFLARLVVQGSDRLAALFEGYPVENPEVDGQCRRYFLAVMDASGQMIQAQRLIDPLLDVCNHPHPYGVAADSVGNLFIAFSPSASRNAPLVPANDTLIMSYSREGVFRWKRLNAGMRGGELAVARGLLYAEYARVVLDATSGQPSFTLPSLLGRAVVSSNRLIPAPIAGNQELLGYEAGGLQQRWRAKLPDSWVFWSDQLRLATWQTSKGPRTVALTFVVDGVDSRRPHGLYAFDVQNGAEAFNCRVTLLPSRTSPQLFEVSNGSLGIMSGALDSLGNPGCNKCDPPLAGTAGAFFTLPTPGLSIAQEPWIGTFGGAGHDHREN